MNNFRLLTGFELFSASQGFLLEEISAPGNRDCTKRHVVTNMTIEEVGRGEFVKPSFSLDDARVQELFNQLWQQGYRPKDGSGSSGHLASVQYHLEDMRKLVFNRPTDETSQ